MIYLLKMSLIVLFAYLIGNISPAILIGKLHGIDIRKEGSGNAGTTNVIRVLGLKQGLATLVIDILKGFCAVKLGFLVCGINGAMVAFIAVVAGHCFPVLYNFAGGKGVATTFGCALALNWQSAVIAFAVAVLVLLLFRIMSLASISAVIAYPFIIHLFLPKCTIFAFFMAIFVISMHHENIRRLLKGQEKKIKFKKENK